MRRLGPLKAVLEGWVVFYLLTHGVCLPADDRLDLGELLTGLWYGWVTAAVGCLGRSGRVRSG